MSILEQITHYEVRPNLDHQHLDGKWLVVGVNESLGIWFVDAWVNSKKEAMAIAKDNNDYIASKVYDEA